MFRRTLTALILFVVTSCPAAFAQEAPRAKETPKVKAKEAPKTPATPAPRIQVTPAPRAEVVVEPKIQVTIPGATAQPSPVTLKLARGGKLLVSNRSGRTVITGSDRDTVQAIATSEAGSESVQVQVSGDPVQKILLVVPTAEARRYGREVNLDLKVPRYADVETLENNRGDLEVHDIEGAVLINSGNGEVMVQRAGSLRINRRGGGVVVKEVKGDLVVRNTHGDISVDRVGGQVDVATSNGDLRVSNAGSDVRANSASGDVDVLCVKGTLSAGSASGSINMVGVGGDIDASTASGDVIFKGLMRAGGRYRLKSISGDVAMIVQNDPPGFTATLITYSGEIETDFPIKVDQPLQSGPINRRITGRYGDGQTQITLDSFSSGVKIVKGGAAAIKECK